MNLDRLLGKRSLSEAQVQMSFTRRGFVLGAAEFRANGGSAQWIESDEAGAIELASACLDGLCRWARSRESNACALACHRQLALRLGFARVGADLQRDGSSSRRRLCAARCNVRAPQLICWLYWRCRRGGELRTRFCWRNHGRRAALDALSLGL